MAKEKKPKTIKQQAKTYRNLKWGCFIGEFVSALLPLFIVAMVNKDKYFVEYDGTKFSIAFFMGMALVGITIIGISKDKVTNSLFSFTMKVLIAAFICTLLGDIIKDLGMMLFVLFGGLCGSMGFEEGMKVFEKKQKAKLNSIETAKTNADIEQAGKELKK